MAAFGQKQGKAKQEKKEKEKESQEQIARWGFDLKSTEELEDWGSAWQEVLEGKGVWGGRTRGGRGVQKITGRTNDISVEGITLAFCGRELLQRTTLKLVHGHRYGLIGDNGVGKSTLLRRMAKQTIPGIPLHFRFGYVQQELPMVEDMTILDYVMKASNNRESTEDRLESLRKDEEELEKLMEGEGDNEKLGELAEQLCELVEEIERLELEMQREDERSKQQPSSSSTSNTEEGSRAAITRADVEALGSVAVSVLDGLGLSKPPKRLGLRLSELSGGWRMRAALAQVLINLDQMDVLLLDEPTNHLDLPSIAWLQSFLAASSVIVLFVSHDRTFLDAVATDIIEMKNLQLQYFPGTYADYLSNKEEMKMRKVNALDARARKEAHLQKAIENVKAHGDDSAVRSKQKKLERAAFTKNIDGHKFKLFSLSQMDEDGVRFPELIDGSDLDVRMMKFKLPAVDAAALRLASPDAPVLTMEKCALAYVSSSTAPTNTSAVSAKKTVGIANRPAPTPAAATASAPSALLQDITLQLSLQSRVGIIGRNGKGKSSLLYALAYAGSLGPIQIPGMDQEEEKMARAMSSKNNGPSATTPTAQPSKRLALISGHIWRHHNLRIGVVAQHQIDILADFLWSTPMEYLSLIVQQYNQQQQGASTSSNDAAASAALAATLASAGAVGSGALRYTDQEMRAHLGSFGLSGNLALQKIGSLSGGQKARLSFAAVCVLKPHLLFLDEPSNHLSMEAIEALIRACQDFAGGIVVVSHNRYFLSQVCNELYVVAPLVVPTTKGSAKISSSSSAAAAGSGSGAATISVRRAEAVATGGGAAGTSKAAQMNFDQLLDQAIQEQLQS